MNVYRSSSDIAYATLSVNEFVIGYMMYLRECLMLPKPDVARALDYLIYLHDLLDEIPSVGWSGVKAAHGEIWRTIEQGRLRWDDTVSRSKILTKALRRELLATRLKAEQAKSQAEASLDKKHQTEKKPCPKYQEGECSNKTAHTSDNVTWMHCCATCLKVKHIKYSHTKAGCRRQKAFDEKNKSKNE